MQENPPWNLFHRMGEMVRQGRAARQGQSAIAPGPRDAPACEEAVSRMVDEGCPNS